MTTTTDLDSLLNSAVQAVSTSLVRSGVPSYGSTQNQVLRDYMRPMIAELLANHMQVVRNRTFSHLQNRVMGIPENGVNPDPDADPDADYVQDVED